MKRLRSFMTNENKRLNEANKESGASNWLTVLPLKYEGYDLNIEQIWDTVRLGTTKNAI